MDLDLDLDLSLTTEIIPESISRNEKFVYNPFAVLGFIPGLPAHAPGQGGTQQQADHWCGTFQTLIERL